MKILVVGNGGREHAILWKLRRDDPNARLFVTAGNGGMTGLAESIDIKSNDVAGIGEWAAREKVDLTVVGPEIPLADGIVDHFDRLGLPIFGPSRAAAEIESSKAFAKSLMLRHGIPTAGFAVFTEPESAVEYIEAVGGPLVVKASGLAAGKGAVVCATTAEAVDAARGILSGTLLGQAGERLVVEDFMQGEELSVFALCDGERFVTLPAAQDHKTVGEGDTGPNTGGMGAYTPVSVATPELIQRIEVEIIRPTLEAMAAEGRPYRGVLYAGLMLTETGPKVVEFNCRFGDPEAQVIIPMLRSSLIELLAGAANGALPSPEDIEWRPGAALTTVMASGGYPGDYTTGVPLDIPPELSESPDVIVFHAGTRIDGGRLVTAGGRVLAVTGFGATVTEAADRSRGAAEAIRFAGRTFRRDIGWREIRRLGSHAAG